MSFTAKIDANIQGFEDGLNKAGLLAKQFEKQIKDSTEGIAQIGQKLSDIGAKASIMSAALVAAGGKAFKMAADFQDAMGATEQIFNESSEAVNSWAKNLNSYYGIAKKDALEYANIMGSMLKNIGRLSEEEAGRTAGNLVELAGDLTAMFGGQTQDAVRALTGALKGNNTMLDNYGMAVNDALVKTRAFEMGLSDGKGELELHAKQAATLSLIYEQTASAQGQAAREADSASGSMRALTVEVKNLATEFGEVLLPIITPVISSVRSAVSALRTMSPEMQSTIVIVGSLAAAFGPLLLMTGKIITMLPVLKIAFFALTSPIGLVVAAVVAGVALIISNWDNIVKYFTTGGGAAVFNKVKELAEELWAAMKSIWEGLTNDISLLWEKFGKYLTGSFAIAFDSVMKIVQVALDVILGFFRVFANLAQGNFKGAWEAIKTMTANIWDGIWGVLKNTLAGMTNAIAAFFELIGASGVAEKMRAFAAGIAPVLAPKTTEIIVDVKEQTVGATKKLTEDLKALSTETAKLGGTKERTPTNITIPSMTAGNLTGLSTTAIDPLGGLSMTEYTEKYRQAAEEIKMITFDMKEYMVDAFVNMWSSIGDALVNGKNVLKSIGSSLLGSLGRVMVDLGKMVLMGGSAIVAIKKALTSLNGPVAIAAGAALIAVGSIFAAGASKLGNSMGSGGGMGGSSSVAGMQTTVTPVTPSYRGSYFDGSEVTFKIGTNELVGVLAMADNRKNRL